MTLRAPFPWFGGKSAVAAEVWRRFGDVRSYVEPFFGSGAVLLARPQPFRGVETVNDKDGLLANFWRALQAEPEAVARFADWPVNEADLHARHLWLVGQRETLTDRLMADPEWYDVKAAGWWVWGACAWIGSGWCSGEGTWRSVDGVLVDTGPSHLPGDARQMPSVRELGVRKQLPAMSPPKNGARGVHQRSGGPVAEWFEVLAARMRRVRVACGDWSRVVGSGVLGSDLTAVCLDAPYTDGDLDYAVGGTGGSVASAAREWAVANGDNPLLRIALCGYEGEHEMPPGWVAHRWKARGGYGNQGGADADDNRHRETVWFSRHCLNETVQPSLFGEAHA